MAPSPTSPAGPTVVGIGASAGGLEAYEAFFRHLPGDSGLAFVLVQHLDPSHASLLSEILQRCTAMPVLEAEDQMATAANTVYVIPPNHDMTLCNGRLRLSTPELPRGQRMPIDTFFRSLADERRFNAVGIILSGTGTDGTLGLRAIYGAGGITFAQEPASAKFAGMPESVTRAGYASHVLPVEDIPTMLLASLRQLATGDESQTTADATTTPAATADDTSAVLALLLAATGHDFSLYKKGTIGRRIARRMVQHQLTGMDAYVSYIREHPAESQALFKDLLVNVTSFFRDPEAFEVLGQEIIPNLLAGKPADYVLRVWVAGCATGEETYSIAMLIRESMEQAPKALKVQIYSTDLDEEAITVARAGFYPLNVTADLTAERLQRFFQKEDGGYRIKKEVREMIVFAAQNVIKDPPFTRLDLISCRNVMIYLEPALQNRLIPALHYALKLGGVLFLSPAESIGEHGALFTPLNRKWQIYRAINSTASSRAFIAGQLSWPIAGGARPPEEVATKAGQTNLAELTRRALLQSFAPASVVTDAKGAILFVHGDTGRFLRPAPGRATLNVVEMALDDLQLELRAALLGAAEQGTATTGRELSARIDGKLQRVSLSVRPLPSRDSSQQLLLVSFQDVLPAVPGPSSDHTPGHGAADEQRVAELERDLAHTWENLQATIESQQASNEELMSTNEELQSTNEELQSTNEELETSKEELQSINEELVTVNAELQATVDQLAKAQNDLKNLIDNVSGGIVFLDQHLHIRCFTHEMKLLFRLTANDVGRPLADIKCDIVGADLLGNAQAVIDTQQHCEREVHTVHGTSYQARLKPYRTRDETIDGVVITFADISDRVEAEARVSAARLFSESVVDTVREPLLVLAGDLSVVAASRSFYKRFRVSAQETIGRRLYDLGERQWDIPALRDLLTNILPRDQAIEDFTVEHDFAGVGHLKMVLNARRITGEQPLILLAMEEVTSA
ncbi:chemotaxis protein CheB [Accumulibacter sp.]|uniref:chemotaxis protein CheB n=1 Tax=Accumulibacter sp. TaxID=2053492 RepID=UPI0028C506EC|nr:chemotaxis protein CheB [Accumulibacter sp.]